MSRSINAFLLDSCLEYEPFLEEIAKDQQLQQLQRNSFEIFQDTCSLHWFRICVWHHHRTITPKWWIFLFFQNNLSHPDANTSIQLITERIVWPRMKSDISFGEKPVNHVKRPKSKDLRLLPIFWWAVYTCACEHYRCKTFLFINVCSLFLPLVWSSSHVRHHCLYHSKNLLFPVGYPVSRFLLSLLQIEVGNLGQTNSTNWGKFLEVKEFGLLHTILRQKF